MPQTYQCDVCNQVAGDFMITHIADGRVVSVGIECLPIWAVPMAAAWVEALIDQGAEVPDWAGVIIDARNQLLNLDAEASSGPEEPTGPPEPPDTDPEPEEDSGGRGEAGDTGQDDGREDTEAAAATHEPG